MESYFLTPRLINLENRAGEIPMMYTKTYFWILSTEDMDLNRRRILIVKILFDFTILQFIKHSEISFFSLL